METNEIMNNEQVIEVVEEVVTTDSTKVLKALGAVGLVAGVGVLTYKFVVKPIVAKVKAKKEAADEAKDFEPVEDEIAQPEEIEG